MTTDFSQTIFNSISEAIKEDYQSFTSSRSLVTQNSKSSLRWDLINTNISEKLKSSSIEVAIARMGFWKFLLLLDKKENILYSLMNFKRYEDIVVNPQKNAPLYFKALVQLNSDFQVVSPSLFDFDNEEDSNGLKAILNRLCNSFSSKNDFGNIHYNVITFSTDINNSVVGLVLKQLDRNMQEISETNLLDTVMPIYSNEIEQVSDIDIEQPLLKIKKKGELRKGEKANISIKSDADIVEKQA